MSNKQSESPFKRSIRRFFRDPYGMAGLSIVGVLILFAIFAPVLANDRPLAMRYDGSWYFPAVRELFRLQHVTRDYPFYLQTDPIDFYLDNEPAISYYLSAPVPWSPYDINLDRVLQPPNSVHRFGTDDVGRDVLARMLHGAGISLAVGFISTGVALVIGLLMGALSGYYLGWVDVVIQRIIEIFMCFPAIFLLLAVMAFLEPNALYIMTAIGLVGWTGFARLIRGEFIRLRNREFTTAAEALGANDSRIIRKHILPNAMGPVLVLISFGIATAMLAEAGLSFLGFGIQPPTPTWGNILSLARNYIEFAWWLALYPGLAIFLGVLGYNLLGEGLRDAFDPRAK